MTTIAEKAAYDRARRPRYAQRAAQLRKNPDRVAVEREAIARWKSRPENWVKVLIANAKLRAKKSGVEFALSPEDVALVEICLVLGIPLSMGGSTKAERDSSPSLDRLDNGKGYVPGNVRIISWRANRLKSDASASEIARILAYVRGEV